MDRPTDKLKILVAHERPALGQAIHHVLAAQGFSVAVVSDSAAAAEALRGGSFAALVLDVALPGPLVCYDLIQLAKGLTPPVKVVLVASVFRKTSYKRRPTQLYGADDYVEIHHLGDQLPGKLWRLLGSDPSDLAGMIEAEAVLATFQEGDQRLIEQQGHTGRLSELIVADVILYAGDKVMSAHSSAEARALLSTDLEGARQLYRQINPAPAGTGDDPIGVAFDEMIRSFNLDDGEPTTR